MNSLQPSGLRCQTPSYGHLVGPADAHHSEATVLNLAALDEQVLAQPKFADHPAWKDRADRAITAADKLLFQRLDHDGVIALWEAFWAVVPDAWMEANTWAALAARNQAVLAYLQSLAADEPLDIVAMQTAYFAAAPDPAPQLRPHFMEVRE